MNNIEDQFNIPFTPKDVEKNNKLSEKINQENNLLSISDAIKFVLTEDKIKEIKNSGETIDRYFIISILSELKTMIDEEHFRTIGSREDFYKKANAELVGILNNNGVKHTLDSEGGKERVIQGNSIMMNKNNKKTEAPKKPFNKHFNAGRFMEETAAKD